MTDSTTFSEISKEDRMRIYDYYERNKCTCNELREMFPELPGMSDFTISQCMNYGVHQIIFFSGYREQYKTFYEFPILTPFIDELNKKLDAFTNYRESEIRIVSEENR